MSSQEISITNVATLNAPSKEITEEGYYRSYNTKIARDGILEYSGMELNRPGMRMVKAYRPKGSFTDKVLESAKLLPVTMDHPSENKVDSKNAKATVIGATGSEVYVKDGDLIEKEIVIYDKDAVAQIEQMGKKEVSIGLLARHEFTPGVTPEGEKYDCIEHLIKINHLSVVSEGKAGPKYRLNSKEDIKPMTDLVKRMINGVEVEMPRISADLLDAQDVKNATEATTKSVSELSDKVDALNAKISEFSELKSSFETFVNAYNEDMKGKEKKDDKSGDLSAENKDGATSDEDEKKKAKELGKDKSDKDVGDTKENECSNSKTVSSPVPFFELPKEGTFN